MLYLKLFFEFFKTGLFAIGGGLATIPFLNEIGMKTHWFTTSELTNMIAISESTPGPIGINMATYVGYTVAGLPGSLIATIGEVTPCVIIILLISTAMSKYKDNKYVNDAMIGIRAVAIGLLTYATLLVITSTLINVDLFNQSKNFLDLFDIRIIFIFAFTFLLSKKVNTHPVFYLLAAAILGILIL